MKIFGLITCHTLRCNEIQFNVNVLKKAMSEIPTYPISTANHIQSAYQSGGSIQGKLFVPQQRVRLFVKESCAIAVLMRIRVSN